MSYNVLSDDLTHTEDVVTAHWRDARDDISRLSDLIDHRPLDSDALAWRYRVFQQLAPQILRGVRQKLDHLYRHHVKLKQHMDDLELVDLLLNALDEDHI